MTTHHDPRHGRSPDETGSFWTSKAFLVCLGFLAIALVFLWSEHRAHILGAALWLLLLACPLLHIFMHGGHGSHGQRKRGAASHDGGRHD